MMGNMREQPPLLLFMCFRPHCVVMYLLSLLCCTDTTEFHSRHRLQPLLAEARTAEPT